MHRPGRVVREASNRALVINHTDRHTASSKAADDAQPLIVAADHHRASSGGCARCRQWSRHLEMARTERMGQVHAAERVSPSYRCWAPLDVSRTKYVAESRQRGQPPFDADRVIGIL